jgi:hypothetical protein
MDKGRGVEDNSMINSYITVMRSLSIKNDNEKCKNQDPNHLKCQP